MPRRTGSPVPPSAPRVPRFRCCYPHGLRVRAAPGRRRAWSAAVSSPLVSCHTASRVPRTRFPLPPSTGPLGAPQLSWRSRAARPDPPACSAHAALFHAAGVAPTAFPVLAPLHRFRHPFLSPPRRARAFSRSALDFRTWFSPLSVFVRSAQLHPLLVWALRGWPGFVARLLYLSPSLGACTLFDWLAVRSCPGTPASCRMLESLAALQRRCSVSVSGVCTLLVPWHKGLCPVIVNSGGPFLVWMDCLAWPPRRPEQVRARSVGIRSSPPSDRPLASTL